MSDNALPTGWRAVQLGELLTTEQLLQASVLLKQGEHAQLRSYLDELAPELEAKGVLPAFLYYALVHHLAPVL